MPTLSIQFPLKARWASERRYAEAEPLLVHSYDEIHISQGDRDPRTTAALKRMVTLYDAWQKPERAAQYRALLK